MGGHLHLLLGAFAGAVEEVAGGGESDGVGGEGVGHEGDEDAGGVVGGVEDALSGGLADLGCCASVHAADGATDHGGVSAGCAGSGAAGAVAWGRGPHGLHDVAPYSVLADGAGCHR